MKLSLPQQDIFYEQLLYPEDPIYNIGGWARVNGPFDVSIFEQAYYHLVRQHDSFRTIFCRVQGEVVAKILTDYQPDFEFVDFSDSESPNQDALCYMQKEFIKPFDVLSGNLLHKYKAVKVSEHIHYYYCVFHHIIIDGWGSSLAYQRVIQNYNELLEFGEVRTTYPFSYQDFLEDDLNYIGSIDYKKDRDYWLAKFNQLPEPLFARINEIENINKSKREVLIVKRSLYNKLCETAKSCKVSTFHLILGALFVYFSRTYNNKDFAIGLPVLNRGKRKFKQTIGLFMGVSLLRLQMDLNGSFKSLVNNIKQQLRQDYRHQRFPLGKLIQELKIFKEKEKLFNLTLSYEKQDYTNKFTNTELDPVPATHESERVALGVYIREFDEQSDVKIDFDYNINYFKAPTIQRIIAHIEVLLKNIIQNHDEKLFVLDYLTSQEKNDLIYNFNKTHLAIYQNSTVLDLFYQNVKEFPNKIAALDNKKSFSYFQLNELSDRIAQNLSKIVEPDQIAPIACLLDRSVDLLAVQLGVMKLGRPFIPLDPVFPRDRIEYILDHSKAGLLIDNVGMFSNKGKKTKAVNLENIYKRDQTSFPIPKTIVNSEDTAYIIYTSGSTGNPKGVEVGHRSLLNFLKSMAIKPGFHQEDFLFSVTTPAFDISLLEFYVPLIAGGTVYIANQDLLSDPAFIIDQINAVNPSILQATPSFYQMLFNAGWKGKRDLKVLCGGDSLSEVLAKKILESCHQLWNMYGPTETTIWSSTKKIENPNEASNIGKPIANTALYILDEFHNPLPVDIPGEIFIGGKGLAKGYFHNKPLTQNKFILNPFEEGLMYQTGDIGKWNKSGEIIFLGRNDNQVKIRGFRIELGEIEARLNEMDNINQAVVVVNKKDPQNHFLVGYIITENENFEQNRVKSTLRNYLPEYMIPQTLVPLEEMPLTPNKKINRKELSQRSLIQLNDSNDLNHPTKYLDKKLEKLWQIILKNKGPIGLNESFFEIGGHSLNAVKLVTLVKKTLQYNISLKSIFDYPTIEQLANFLQEREIEMLPEISPAAIAEFYPLSSEQYNIWLAAQHPGLSIAYNMPIAYSLNKAPSLEKIESAIQEIIEKHEVLRTNFLVIEGSPCQKVVDFDSVHFKITTAQISSGDLMEAISTFINNPFDIENELLLKVKLFQLDSGKFILVFNTHHIIMDGWSSEIFINEFISNYNGTIKEKTSILQYRDYAVWNNSNLNTIRARNTGFWKSYLDNYSVEKSFNWLFDHHDRKSYKKEYDFVISEHIFSQLKAVVQEIHSSTHSSMVALITLLIHKLSGREDICIGTLNAGRTKPELNATIGMFVKTLPVRAKVNANSTFKVLLEAIHEDILLIDDYQYFPLELSEEPLFDVLVNYQNPDFSASSIQQLEDLNLAPYPINTDYCRFPLVFNCIEEKDGITFHLEYDGGKFDDETIYLITLKLTQLFNKAVDILTTPIHAIDLSLEFEQKDLIDIDLNF